MSGSWSESSSTSKMAGWHIPIEISKLIHQFLLASDENVLTPTVTSKRRREVELVVPSKYVALTKRKEFACILEEKFCENTQNILILKWKLSVQKHL